MIFKKLAQGISAQKQEQRKAELYRNLIRREGRIGGQLFGPIAPGGRRDFFCLDEHTWIWHEEWLDEQGQRQIRTTRYDIRPNGILKAQNGQPYQPLSKDEAINLYEAARRYYDRIRAEIYNFV